MTRAECSSEQKTDNEHFEKKNINEIDVNARRIEDANAQKMSKRRLRAQELGLSDNSTWGEIAKVRSEQERVERVQQLGLQEDATWGEIFHHMNEMERQ